MRANGECTDNDTNGINHVKWGEVKGHMTDEEVTGHMTDEEVKGHNTDEEVKGHNTDEEVKLVAWLTEEII